MVAEGQYGQKILLLPDFPELEITFKEKYPEEGYDWILVHENIVAEMRVSTWYRRLIQIKVPKIFIVKRKINFPNEISSFSSFFD